jgi:ketosteroid isomerase-like protein
LINPQHQNVLSMKKAYFLVAAFFGGLLFLDDLKRSGENMKKQTVYAFANAINEHSVDKIYSLMTDDHTFVDAHGNEVKGKDKMKSGWSAYFQWFPDYKIEILDLFMEGDILAAFGFASATFHGNEVDSKENHWRLPASWKIVVDHDKIRSWQVYADTKIPFEIISRNK